MKKTKRKYNRKPIKTKRRKGGGKKINYDKDPDKCAICLEDFNNNDLVYQLGCGHIFHIDCLNDHCLSQESLANSAGWSDHFESPNHFKCPLCRTKIDWTECTDVWTHLN